MDVFLCALVCLAVVVYRWWRRAPEHDLTGKVVVVTGAGGGLGRALSLSLAERGCRLACVDIASKPNEETASMVSRGSGRKHGGKLAAKAYTVDLTKREEIAALVENVIEDFGQIDILVNNAGQLQGGALWDLTEDQLDLLLDVNLRACMLLIRSMMPHMRARRSGHIVTVSAMAGIVPGRKMSGYASSKAGASHLNECLYYDLVHEGLHEDIHVTTVNPFFISTFPQINSFVKFVGPAANIIFPFLEPKDAAEAIAKSIATRQHELLLPDYLGISCRLMSLLPRRAQSFAHKYLIQAEESSSPYPYRARHAPLDADLMFELLSNKFGLCEDPESVCTGLRAEYSSKGKALPYDFTPFADSIRAHYAALRRPVPDDVKSVFALN